MKKIEKAGSIDIRELGAQEAISWIGQAIAVACRELMDIDPNQWYSVYLQKLAQISGANDMLLAIMKTMIEYDIDFMVTVPSELRIVAVPNPYHEEDTTKPIVDDVGDVVTLEDDINSINDFPF